MREVGVIIEASGFIAGTLMRMLKLILGVASALWATQADAWNGRGHMIVAAVAWSHLTPATQARASALLSQNPNYADWTNGVAPGQKDQIAFVMAATWPDYIKHASGYQNDGEDPTDPGAAQNIGYSDHLMHKYWHYIDVPFSPDGTPLVQPKVPNARTQIEAFRSAIASTTASDDVKSYDLAWLEHLVGDVHQPLHATSRFTHTFMQGDQGGNLVCLGTTLATTSSGQKKCRTELHAFWDDALGLQTKNASDPENAVKAIAVAASLSAADPTKAADADDEHWIDESFQTAQSVVYKTPIKKGMGPYKLTATYQAKARKIAKERAELAGERLAHLLNDNLK